MLALESLLAGDPRTARPKPDIAKLEAARPIAETPGIMGYAEEQSPAAHGILQL